MRNMSSVPINCYMDMVTALILVQDQVLAREDVMQDVVQVCSSQNYLIETAKKSLYGEK